MDLYALSHFLETTTSSLLFLLPHTLIPFSVSRRTSRVELNKSPIKYDAETQSMQGFAI